ncbi:PRC-barrel domain-containing protein [Candidatus Micrarchaeota archaeon]|nr:PRC-barrel domain-containing protein [Candidatus Micrarchaeota archaeon]
MTVRLSKLFGMDIYTDNAEYKGKVFDLVVNLEKGRVETITTEPLKVKSKQEAKKIIKEKSVPYRNVKSAKDILIVRTGRAPEEDEEEKPAHRTYQASQRNYNSPQPHFRRRL